MTSSAERKRQKREGRKANPAKPRAEAAPSAAPKRPAPSVERLEERDGLLWLIHKGRLTNRRMAAALAYRAAYREPQESPLQSGMASLLAGGGGNASKRDVATGINAARIDAERRLTAFRAALSFSTDMVLVMDGVAGGGQTLRGLAGDAKGAQKRADQLEALFMAACDCIASHTEELARLAAERDVQSRATVAA